MALARRGIGAAGERYARLGDDRIAYQALGQGPPDLIYSAGSFSHVDIVWEEPRLALFLRNFASFSRFILFDRLGTGASDPLPLHSLPPWESYAEELTAVLDEVGSEQAAIMVQLDAGPMGLFFAGTRPNNTPPAATARRLSLRRQLGRDDVDRLDHRWLLQ